MRNLQNLAEMDAGEARFEKRIVKRKQASAPLQVEVETSSGGKCSGLLRDISTYGCNVVTPAGLLRIGNFVSIRINPDRAIQAVVRWCRDGVNGAEFLRPISEREAQQIAALFD